MSYYNNKYIAYSKFNELIEKFEHIYYSFGRKETYPEYTKFLIHNFIKCLKKSHLYGAFMVSNFRIAKWDEITDTDLKNSFYKRRDYATNIAKGNTYIRIHNDASLYSKEILNYCMSTCLIKEKNEFSSVDEELLDKIFEAYIKFNFVKDKNYLFSYISPITFGVDLGFLIALIALLSTTFIMSMYSIYASLWFTAFITASSLFVMLKLKTFKNSSF